MSLFTALEIKHSAMGDELKRVTEELESVKGELSALKVSSGGSAGAGADGTTQAAMDGAFERAMLVFKTMTTFRKWSSSIFSSRHNFGGIDGYIQSDGAGASGAAAAASSKQMDPADIGLAVARFIADRK